MSFLHAFASIDKQHVGSVCEMVCTSVSLTFLSSRSYGKSIMLLLYRKTEPAQNMSRKEAEKRRKIGGIHKHVVGKTAEWDCTMEDGVPCLSFFCTNTSDMGEQFHPKSHCQEFHMLNDINSLRVREFVWVIINELYSLT